MDTDLQTISDNDARDSAVHEAGHAVVARHLGSDDVTAYIERTGTTNPLLEKAWIGQCRSHTLGLSDLDKRRIGIAGWAALYVEHDPDTYYVMDDLTDPNAMSPSDWSQVGVPPGDPDGEVEKLAEEIIGLLRGPLRAALYAEARIILDAADQHHVTLPA
jgi:hypothetical protein